MILSEKDIRVAMKDVTTNWHEGKLSKHPEADVQFHF
jgi:hypothetical protein